MTTEQDVRERIDEIILKPAQWSYDDYQVAQASLLVLIDSIAAERSRRERLDLIEQFKKLWYYAGRWHQAECPFILYDQGVCNCPKGLAKLTTIRDQLKQEK